MASSVDLFCQDVVPSKFHIAACVGAAVQMMSPLSSSAGEACLRRPNGLDRPYRIRSWRTTLPVIMHACIVHSTSRKLPERFKTKLCGRRSQSFALARVTLVAWGGRVDQVHVPTHLVSIPQSNSRTSRTLAIPWMDLPRPHIGITKHLGSNPPYILIILSLGRGLVLSTKTLLLPKTEPVFTRKPDSRTRLQPAGSWSYLLSPASDLCSRPNEKPGNSQSSQ